MKEGMEKRMISIEEKYLKVDINRRNSEIPHEVGTMWYSEVARTLRFLTEIKDGKECWMLINSEIPDEIGCMMETFFK